MQATLRCLLLFVFVLLAGQAEAADGDPNAALPFMASQSGKRVTLTTADGKTFAGYMAGPRGAVWGILLVPEPWGFDDHLRAWADHLASLGYRVLAIDTYDGKVPRSPDEAKDAITKFNQTAADGKYRAALGQLKAPGRKIATMGFGTGGEQALRATLVDANDVRATIMYQTPPPTDASLLKSLKSPVFSVYTNQDASIPPEQIKTFEDAMKRTSKSLTVRRLDTAPESLLAPGDRYSGPLVQAAWQDTQAFLKKNEKDPPCTRCDRHKKRHKVRKKRR